VSTPAVAAPLPSARVNVRLVFAGLMLVLLLAALDQTIVATALPTIVSGLGGLSRLAWVTSAFLLAQTVVTPIYGKLGDLYGRKRVLQSAILVFLLGSALCGQAQSMTEGDHSPGARSLPRARRRARGRRHQSGRGLGARAHR